MVISINYPGAHSLNRPQGTRARDILSPLALKASGKKCCAVFLPFLMAMFAFGVSGEYPCQSEFIPPFKMPRRRLNAL